MLFNQPRETDFVQFVERELSPFFAQCPVQFFDGKNGIKIAFQHFSHATPASELVILVSGRAENLRKWAELAYDFYQQGYDVLLFDHRGQGFSNHLLADSEKGHLDDFRFYVGDMAKLIHQVTALQSYRKQFLVCHSLGSLIASFYLANYDHQISQAVFESPFFGVPLKHPVRDKLIISLLNLFAQGQRYVFGKGKFQPVNPIENLLSGSTVRMQRMNEINQQQPELRLGGPTFRWVHLCINAIHQLPKILPRIEIPVLILQAEQEKIVCNKKIPNLTALLPNGKRIIMQNAKHEILFEQDVIRQQAIQQILDFLQRKNEFSL